MKGEGDRGEKSGDPEGGGLKISRLFFFLPPPLSQFLTLGSFRGTVAVVQGHGRLGFCGVIGCEPRQAAGVSHIERKEPKSSNGVGHNLDPGSQFNEKTPEREKKKGSKLGLGFTN